MSYPHQEGGCTVSDYTTTFRIVDADDDGLISATELTRLMEVLGQPITPEAATAAVARMDKDGDGLISLEEFAAYLG
nr:EF-hand domain-containing protein [Planobispora takensis]